MCRLVVSEDDAVGELEQFRSTVNDVRHMDPELQAQIARLEARISGVEARMEKLEVSVLYLRRRVYFYGIVCLLSVLYALFK